MTIIHLLFTEAEGTNNKIWNFLGDIAECRMGRGKYVKRSRQKIKRVNGRKKLEIEIIRIIAIFNARI